jgi:hypothetical protein
LIDFYKEYPIQLPIFEYRHAVYSILDSTINTEREDLISEFSHIRHQVGAGNPKWNMISSPRGNFHFWRTIFRLLKGRQIKSKNKIIWKNKTETAFINSHTGLKKNIAKIAFRVYSKKLKRKMRKAARKIEGVQT